MAPAVASLVAALGAALGAAAADSAPPDVVHQSCRQYTPAVDYEIRVEIHDASGLFDPKVIYRTKATPGWRNLALQPRGEVYFATIPKAELVGPLEYFVETFDVMGNGPTRVGTTDAPLRVTPADKPAACTQVAADCVATATDSGAGGSSSGAAGTSPAASGGAPAAKGPVVPPPPGRCEVDDRPLWCEPWLWVLAGGIVAAGAIGVGVGVGLAGQASRPETVSVNIFVPAI